MPIGEAVGVALAGDAGGAGAGAGEGGAGEGGGEGGGEGQGEGGEGQVQGQGEGGEGGEQEFEIDESTGEPKTDEQGNKIPKQAAKPGKVDFKTIHAKLKEVDPAAADAYRKTHFGYQQYQQAFATPAEAVAAKELFETYGGSEGIEKLSSDAQTLASEAESFSKGDPEFIAKLAKDDPEGFAATAPHYIKQLGLTNPDAYTAALTPIINATFDRTGLSAGIVKAGQLVDSIYTALEKAGDKTYLPYLNQAIDSLNAAWGVVDKYKKLGDQYGERPLTDKEKSLQLREQKLNDQQRTTFFNEASRTVRTNFNASITKALVTYYKQFPKITADQKADLQTGVFDFINTQLNSNKKYGDQMKALMREGNIDKINNYVMQNVNKMVVDAAKKVWNRRGFGLIPNQAGKGAGDKGNTGTVNLTRRPKRDDIDWNVTSEEEYMAGSATLKGIKRKVKWDWSRQES